MCVYCLAPRALPAFRVHVWCGACTHTCSRLFRTCRRITQWPTPARQKRLQNCLTAPDIAFTATLTSRTLCKCKKKFSSGPRTRRIRTHYLLATRGPCLWLQAVGIPEPGGCPGVPSRVRGHADSDASHTQRSKHRLILFITTSPRNCAIYCDHVSALKRIAINLENSTIIQTALQHHHVHGQALVHCRDAKSTHHLYPLHHRFYIERSILHALSSTTREVVHCLGFLFCSLHIDDKRHGHGRVRGQGQRLPYFDGQARAREGVR